MKTIRAIESGRNQDTTAFRQWQQQMDARYRAAQRLQPYDHRPWDRGFNPWEDNN